VFFPFGIPFQKKFFFLWPDKTGFSAGVWPCVFSAFSAAHDFFLSFRAAEFHVIVCYLPVAGGADFHVFFHFNRSFKKSSFV